MPNEILDSPGSVNEFARQRNSKPTEVLPEYTKALGEYRRQRIGEISTKVATEESTTEEEN